MSMAQPPPSRTVHDTERSEEETEKDTVRNDVWKPKLDEPRSELGWRIQKVLTEDQHEANGHAHEEHREARLARKEGDEC